MYVKNLIFAVLLCILPTLIKAQTYVYSYADPCTGIVKTINVPTNGVTVTYFGQMNTFNPVDFTNGNFNNWANGVYSSFGGNNPCGSTIGITTSISMAQNTAMNVLGIMNTLDVLSSISGGGMNTNGVTESSKTESKSSNKKNKNNNSGGSTTGGSTTGTTGGSTGGGTTTGGSTGSTASGSTAGGTTGGSTTGGSTTGGSTTGGSGTESNGSGTTGSGSVSGNSNPNQNGSTGSDAATSEEKKSSNILGGSVGSIQNSTSTSTTSSKGGSSPTKGNAPTIVLSSDFAGFNFKQGDVNYGGKGTAGWTSLNWDGSRSHGFMLDYTSANKGPNFTVFFATIKKRRINLISVTGTTSFYGKGSLYGTVALGQMWSFSKVKNLKAIYMATSSYGNVYGTKFIGTAFIAGGMYDFKIGKRTQIKLTNLFIYAPYISYYNDMVLKSPYVIMPIIGTNIGVTKKFKLNVNLGGTYALGEDVLNFTVMMGTRFAL